MLNDLQASLKSMQLTGKRVYCAVSGGADSMALLFGMYLLREKMQLDVRAAHFNHGLRGEESARDEQFVRDFCDRLQIPLEVGSAAVRAGEKGLEAAAREARYGFFATLPGLVATAHTADDNAETVLMHLVRGTGLKGLGGIAPMRGTLIRPMLQITRQQVLEFLNEYHVCWIEDSSNAADDFLRNRLRHHVMPLLLQENPRFSQNVSAMARSLRQDAATLEELAEFDKMPSVTALRQMDAALRSRFLERFLKRSGVKEPERTHIVLLEQLVFSSKPSAWARFPNDVSIHRVYDSLAVLPEHSVQEPVVIRPGVQLKCSGWLVTCSQAEKIANTPVEFTFHPQGEVCLRGRFSGDEIRLSGGTKSLKKLFIDRKIPAALRQQIPVLADDGGVVGVCGIGADIRRTAQDLPALYVCFEKIDDSVAL